MDTMTKRFGFPKKLALTLAVLAPVFVTGPSSAQTSRPAGDFVAQGVLTVDNGVIDDFTCAVKQFGRAVDDGTGSIHAALAQNTTPSPNPGASALCASGITDPARGVRFLFGDTTDPTDPLQWTYEIDPIAGTITIEGIAFRADPALGLPGCGAPNDGTVVADWVDGNPDFADGNTTHARIVFDNTPLTSVGGNDCVIAPDGPQALEVFFKVGAEVTP